jgi:diaminopimelate epimerase
MLKIPFTKMEATANDFVVIDDRENVFAGRECELGQRLCERRTGIGADGIIFVRKPPVNVDAAAEMAYYNADGGYAGMCGNGLRCTALYVSRLQGSPAKEIVISVNGRPHTASIKTPEGAREDKVALVIVGMGVPDLDVESLPSLVAGPQHIGRPLQLADGFIAECTLVSMGNPHCVMWLEKVSDELVSEMGPMVERSQLFPEGVNAGFARMAGKEIDLRVWERGCGETMACGSGACAAVVSAVLTGRAKKGQVVTVHMRGGQLIVAWPGEGMECTLGGPARVVFEGTVEV